MNSFALPAEIHQECKIDRIGNSYRGYQTTTRTGRTCQRWTSQSPHQHSMTWKGFPEGNMEAAMNYCRNPDREPDGPWCYTTDPEVRWEYCDIPMCWMTLCLIYSHEWAANNKTCPQIIHWAQQSWAWGWMFSLKMLDQNAAIIFSLL